MDQRGRKKRISPLGLWKAGYEGMHKKSLHQYSVDCSHVTWILRVHAFKDHLISFWLHLFCEGFMQYLCWIEFQNFFSQYLGILPSNSDVLILRVEKGYVELSWFLWRKKRHLFPSATLLSLSLFVVVGFVLFCFSLSIARW